MDALYIGIAAICILTIVYFIHRFIQACEDDFR